MQTQLMPLSTDELEEMTPKEILQYLVSFPCYLFLKTRVCADIHNYLNNWDVKSKELTEKRIKVGIIQRGLKSLDNVSMSSWEAKIAKNLKSAMADIKK